MTRPQIMVVEDESIVAEDMKAMLEGFGYAVPAVAFSGEEAVKKAFDTHPDLVLMDIGLPGEMNGLEAGARIWEELKIPIVYVTAYADEQGILQARTPQPVLAVRKPFNATQLRDTLEQVLAAPR